eukprot:scaffold244920_cov24-Tisochrysis_lutea.AAC.1
MCPGERVCNLWAEAWMTSWSSEDVRFAEHMHTRSVSLELSHAETTPWQYRDLRPLLVLSCLRVARTLL